MTLVLIERPIERPAAPVRESWQRIERWLAEHAPEILRSLRPPATEDDLQRLEKIIGQRLPDDVRESYLVHDGQIWFREYEEVDEESGELVEYEEHFPGVFFGIGLMPLFEGEGVEWCWLYRIADKPEDDENAAEFREGFRSYPTGAIRLSWRRRGWIPLYWDSGRSFLGVDLEPGPTGRVGQVIPFGWEIGYGSEEKQVLAQSWGHFLEDVADEFEAGAGRVEIREDGEPKFILNGAVNGFFCNEYPAWSKAKLPQSFQQREPA